MADKKTAILVDPVVGNIIKRLAVMHNIKMGEVIEKFCMPMFEEMLIEEAQAVVSSGRVGRKPKIEMTVPSSAAVVKEAPVKVAIPPTLPAVSPKPATLTVVSQEREPGSDDDLDDDLDDDQDDDQDDDLDEGPSDEEEAELRELINSSRCPF